MSHGISKCSSYFLIPITTCLKKVFALIKAKVLRTCWYGDCAEGNFSPYSSPSPSPPPPHFFRKKFVRLSMPLLPSVKAKAFAFIFSSTHQKVCYAGPQVFAACHLWNYGFELCRNKVLYTKGNPTFPLCFIPRISQLPLCISWLTLI